MRKELLNQFEELELFAENVENALEIARQRSEHVLDLRLFESYGLWDIFSTEASIQNYNDILIAVKKIFKETERWRDETFIDIYENAPAEAVYTGVTIWLNYVDGRIESRVES